MTTFNFTKPIIYCYRDRFVIRTHLYQSYEDPKSIWPLVVTGETMEIAYAELERMIAAQFGKQHLKEFRNSQWLRMINNGIFRINRMESQMLIGN